MSIKPLFDSSPRPLFESPKKSGPSILFSDSKIRNRINVSAADLEPFSTDSFVINKSIQQILTTNQENLCLEFVLNWGSALQKEHQKTLENFFILSQSAEVSESQDLVGRLVEGLLEIKLDNIKDSFFCSKENKIKKVAAQIEDLKVFSASFVDKSKILFDIREKVRELVNKNSQISADLEPFIVTCSFFSRYQQEGFPNELYIGRLESLLNTKIALAADKLNFDLFSKTLIKLTESVLDTVRSELPLLQSMLISCLTSPDSTDKLSRLQKTITTKLKL